MQLNYLSLSVNSRIVIHVACLLRNVIFVISFFSMFLCCDIFSAVIKPGGLTEYPTYNVLGYNLLSNSGLEDADKNPQGWSSNGFAVDSTVSHSGLNSYRIIDANKIKYAQSARQSVAVNAGIYSIAGWVKVEGLGNVTGGSIRLSLKIGNNSVGTTAKISGTGDWQYIEKQNIIVTKDSAAEFRIECYGEPDGTAWIDDVELKEQMTKPLEAFLLYPNYRGILFDDQTQDIRFDVSVHIETSVRGYYVEGQIVDEADNYLITSKKFPIQDNFIATFDGSVLDNEHTYLVIFRLMDEAGIKYEYPAYRISKLPGVIRPLMTMSFDEHNRFLVRGEPTFILGVYDSGIGYSSSEASWENDLLGKRRRLWELPINFYINYWYGEASAESMTAMMNVLQRHKILYLQTGNCFGESYNQDKFMIDKNDSYLQALSDHPGLGGFYTVDECYPKLAPAMFAQYQRLKAFDPDGITFGASTSPESLSFWRDVCDVLSTDPYPLHWNNKDSLGNYRLSKVADWTRETKETLKSSRPFCTVIQFFQFTSRDRWPTRDELRNMSYMAIVEGANGLFYWSLGQKALAWVKDETKKAEYSESLKAVMWELKDIEQALASIDRPEFLVENSNSSAIRTRVKTSEGIDYLIAYNYTNEPKEAKFTWKQNVNKIQVYNESRNLTPIMNTFADTFGPYQAHVYEINGEQSQVKRKNKVESSIPANEIINGIQSRQIGNLRNHKSNKKPDRPSVDLKRHEEINDLTVRTTQPSLPQIPAEEHALQEADKGELQQNKVSHQKSEVVWLPRDVDLMKHTIGPFTVKVRVEGINEQMPASISPRIMYYIGTGSSYGYFDMIHEGDGVWRFDIPDPKWSKYRSNSLHYQVKIFDEEGNVIVQSTWQIELIDSFVQRD